MEAGSELISTHLVIAMFETFLPATSSYGPSAAAIEAWQTVLSSRMLIHSVICTAAAHYDSERSTQEYTKSREMLAIRGEALRLIHNELSGLRKGDKPSTALLSSVLCLGPEPVSWGSSQTQVEDRGKATTHPFRLRQMQKGWERTYLNMRYCMEHHRGLFALVARGGGLASLQQQNYAVAKLISSQDSFVAAIELRAPWEPFVHDQEVVSLISDTSINVIESDPDVESQRGYTPGSSLPELQRVLGTSSLLASVLAHLQRAMVTADALAREVLRNVNVRVLVDDRWALHHDILSIPPHSRIDTLLYEPVRLVTLVFDVGIVFPQPPATGSLARVVRWMKAALEDIDMENIHDKKILVWILFVGGVAAKEMPERDWFVERLSGLMKSVTRWAEVKQLLRSFVWMPDAMDEEAMDVWDGVRSHGRV